MPASDPLDRSTIASIAALERWGRTHDRAVATAPARAGLRAKFAPRSTPRTLSPL